MAKFRIPEPDGWDMSDYQPEEIVVDAIVMAVKGCGDDDEQVVVITEDGRELRILGVRASDGRPVVEIVVREGS